MKASQHKLYELLEYMHIEDVLYPVTRTYHISLEGDENYVAEWMRKYAIKQMLELLGLYQDWDDTDFGSKMDPESDAHVYIEQDTDENTITVCGMDPMYEVHAFYHLHYSRVW